jgi:hypothetical protein
MAELTLKSKIQFRKDTAANWSSKNPVLKLAEPAWDSTNSRLKIGNGTSAWSNLSWAYPSINIYKDSGIDFKATSGNFTIKILDNSTSATKSSIRLNYNGSVDIFNSNNFRLVWSSSQALFVEEETIANLGTSSRSWDSLYLKTKIESPAGVINVSNSPKSFTITNSVANATSSNKVQSSSIYFQAKRTYYDTSLHNDNKILIFDSGMDNELGASAGSLYQSGKVYLGNNSSSFPRVYAENFIMNPAAVGEIFNTDGSRNFLCLNEPLVLKKWKSFVITGFDAGNKTFTLDSVSGLAVGDTYSTSCTGSVYNNYGQITAISGNTVTVSAVPTASFGSYLNANPSYDHMSWFINSKPEAGSSYITYFDETGTSNFIMVTNAKISQNYYISDPILNSNNNFCFGDGLYIPVNKTYNLYPHFKIGRYDSDSRGTYPFVIGWGSSDTDRKNIFYVNNSGYCYANAYNLISGGTLLEYKHYSGVNMYLATNRKKGLFSSYNPTYKPTGASTTYYGGFNIPLGADGTTYVGQLYFERGEPRMHYHYSTGTGDTAWSSWYKIPVGVCGQITRGTSAPSGGRDGDIYLQY